MKYYMSDSAETVPGQLEDLKQSVDARFKAGDERMGRIEASLKTNTEATQRIDTNTGVLLEWLQAFEGAFKLLNGLGKLAKPVGIIAAAASAIVGTWALFKSGGTPR